MNRAIVCARMESKMVWIRVGNDKVWHWELVDWRQIVF